LLRHYTASHPMWQHTSKQLPRETWRIHISLSTPVLSHYCEIKTLLLCLTVLHITIYVFLPMPLHVPCGLRGLPSRLWPKCNRLLRLRLPWVAVTGGCWHMNMKYQGGRGP
jgi:hypothetical protein